MSRRRARDAACSDGLLQCNRKHSIRDPCTLSQSRPTDGCGDGGRQQRRAECPARPCKVRPDGLRSATASRSQVKSRPCAGQPAARAPAGMFRPGRRGRGGGGARVVPRAVLGPRRAAPAYPGATDPAGGRAGTGAGGAGRTSRAACGAACCRRRRRRGECREGLPGRAMAAHRAE